MATQLFEPIFFLLLYKITLLKVKQQQKKKILSPVLQLKLLLYHFHFRANPLHRIVCNMFKYTWEQFCSGMCFQYSP